jgi:hypothetical protein
MSLLGRFSPNFLTFYSTCVFCPPRRCIRKRIKKRALEAKIKRRQARRAVDDVDAEPEEAEAPDKKGKKGKKGKK